MNKNILSVGITILLLCIAVAPLSESKVIEKSDLPILNGNILYVGGSGEGNYTSIQDAIDNANESTAYIQTHFSRYLDNLPSDIPPPWFSFVYMLIMLSLNARILIVTPLAITPTGEYWGDFEINSYFFFLILFTLVYRFAFWYTFFEKIAEKNNWDLP